MSTQERDKLVQMVQMFAHSDANRCWPTTGKWTLKEAKEALAKQATAAFQEMQSETATL